MAVDELQKLDFALRQDCVKLSTLHGHDLDGVEQAYLAVL